MSQKATKATRKKAAPKQPAAEAPATPAEASEPGAGSHTHETFMQAQERLAPKVEQPAEAPAAEPTPESGATDSDPLAAIAAGEEAIARGSETDDKAGGGPSVVTLKDVAEALGISVEEAYAIQINMDPATKGAEALTIGKLKDVQEEVAGFEARVLQFEEEQTAANNELLRAKQEMTELLAALPKGVVTPELLATARERAAAHREAESAREREAIPEWTDEEVRIADTVGIKAHLAEYGFDGSFFDGIVDHRFKKYLRDNYRRLESVRKALEGVKERKPKAQPPSKRRDATRRPPATVNTSDRPEHGYTTSQLRDRFSQMNRN